MAEKMPQTLENHGKYVPLYHFVLITIVFLNLLWSVWRLIAAFSVESVVSFALAFAFLLMAFYIRAFPLTVHDRVIRLEETLRMQRLLPADLAGRIGELKRGQFVALRFASDDELADLVRRTLEGELRTAKEIKQAIRTWRPDYARV